MIKFVEFLEKYKISINLEAAKLELQAIVGAIFEEFPELTFISLLGYTPSWNDGDPCLHCVRIVMDHYDPDWLVQERFKSECRDRLPEAFL